MEGIRELLEWSSDETTKETVIKIKPGLTPPVIRKHQHRAIGSMRDAQFFLRDLNNGYDFTSDPYASEKLDCLKKCLEFYANNKELLETIYGVKVMT